MVDSNNNEPPPLPEEPEDPKKQAPQPQAPTPEQPAQPQQPLTDPDGFPIGRPPAPPPTQAAPPPQPPTPEAPPAAPAQPTPQAAPPQQPPAPEAPPPTPEVPPQQAQAAPQPPAPEPPPAAEPPPVQAPPPAADNIPELTPIEEPAGTHGDPAELQKELDDMKDQALRAMAEAENTRKRAQKEREDASRYAISSFARDMLDIADNLRRAIEAIPEDLKAADPRMLNVVEGIEATERSLLKTFEIHGIQRLEPMDEPFDPNFHEVMFEAPGTGKPPGTIVQLIEAGYVLKDRLLRPARVGVAKDEGQGGGPGGSDAPPANPTTPGGQIDQEV